MTDELRQHRDSVPTANHLRVHHHRQQTALHMRVHPIKLRTPDLQHLPWRRCAVAIRIKIELKVDPVVELKRDRQLPKSRLPATDQRLLLRDPIADPRAIGPEVVGHQARVVLEAILFQQRKRGP